MSSPLPQGAIKVLLLEGVHPEGIRILSQQLDATIDALPGSISEEELITRLSNGVHILGIRSKTQLTRKILECGKDLMAVGCFCIGTNQVDLVAAHELGVPVFNAPFANTRSVAELVIGEIISLARQIPDRTREMHQGTWKKTAVGCFEVRNKSLGIIGYGHIGSQVGVMAESMGMKVTYYDIVPVLTLGNCRPASLEEVLTTSDFVTLHVPETDNTKNMITAKEIGMMKKGSYLLNLSRGSVVDVDALATALKNGHLAGAAVDVYPTEPEANTKEFVTPLQNCPNTILTPHIGGSTSEAQVAIAVEVCTFFQRFMRLGSSTGAVNFPQIEPPNIRGAHRILNIHKNKPGVLRDINKIVGDLGANIRAQFLETDKAIGYLIIDTDEDVSELLAAAIIRLPVSIKTRVIS
jgi:D-3-phosphoglycerate dehydrogenase